MIVKLEGHSLLYGYSLGWFLTQISTPSRKWPYLKDKRMYLPKVANIMYSLETNRATRTVFKIARLITTQLQVFFLLYCIIVIYFNIGNINRSFRPIVAPIISSTLVVNGCNFLVSRTNCYIVDLKAKTSSNIKILANCILFPVVNLISDCSCLYNWFSLCSISETFILCWRLCIRMLYSTFQKTINCNIIGCT